MEHRFRYRTKIPDGYVKVYKLRAKENIRRRKNDSRALTLVISRFHTWRGAELLGPNPKYPLWNPPGRGAQGSSKLDCVTEWTLYRFFVNGDQYDHREEEDAYAPKNSKVIELFTGTGWRVKASL